MTMTDPQAIRRRLALALCTNNAQRFADAAKAALTPEGRAAALRENVEAIERIQANVAKLSDADRALTAPLVQFALGTEEIIRKILLAGQTSD